MSVTEDTVPATDDDTEAPSGVRVVGAPADRPEKSRTARGGRHTGRPADVADVPAADENAEALVAPEDEASQLEVSKRVRSSAHGTPPSTWVVRVVAVVASVAALMFGIAWSNESGQSGQQSQATAAANKFLVALTNFKPATVDRDFSTITSMATGQFAGQAAKFFNSAIRGELARALAQSQGQVRDLYVQNLSGSQASLYAVVDQVYVNSKVSSPQSDVLRLVLNMTDTSSGWKVANVSVLEGPSPTSGSGSASTSSSAG